MTKGRCLFFNLAASRGLKVKIPMTLKRVEHITARIIAKVIAGEDSYDSEKS